MIKQTSEESFLPPPFPDHTQLPDSDGTFLNNFQKHPQSIILTDSLGPILQKLHPDEKYIIGQDCGIYWRETEPPEKGAESSDWFYIPYVPPLLDGQRRRSYVFWREYTPPLIALEFASGNGEVERDTTPLTVGQDGSSIKPGKFWVYERIIRIPYYGIYEVETGKLDVYHSQDFRYKQLVPNERGHYPITLLGVELGLWQGNYQNQHQLWLRWWDMNGNLLLTGNERAVLEQQRAESAEERAESAEERVILETQRAESAEERAEKLAALLRKMGVDLGAEGLE